MKNTILLLNGHPGAGKSTVAREIANLVPRLAVLDVDLFRKFVSDYNNSAEDVELMWKITNAIIHVYLQQGISVLIDRCITEDIDRENLKKQATKHGADFKEVILYTKTLQAALDRISTRPPKPLSRHKKSMIDKNKIAELQAFFIKYKDTVGVESFDTESVNTESIAEFIAKKF